MTTADDVPQPERIGAYRHLALGDVGSTNTEALERARAGDAGRLWITADRQLQGRGRRGRTWVSEAGNLYASLLLIDPAPVEALGSLPLAVAVAVHRAIEAVLPVQSIGPLRIKWPNDIMLDGAKICGILLESEMLKDGRRALVMGCGINIAHAPPPGLYPTTNLDAVGAATSPEELFARLFVTMTDEIGIWDQGRGVASTRAAWLERATGLGTAITVNLPDRSIRGVFHGIDASGHLILVPDAGGPPVVLAAGDLFFE